ncbi:MAG: LysE family translocator [Propionibacteriaceae bacterium]
MPIPSPGILLAFAIASVIVMVIPGPAVAYVVARSVEHGPRAGLYSVLGLEAAATMHVILAAAGISTLVQLVPMGLRLLAWTGAGYLVWLAIRELMTFRQKTEEAATPTSARPGRLFLDGFLVDLLNPKTLLFFLAFLPQFIDPNRPWAGQVTALGLIFVLIAAGCDTGYALLAGRLSRRLRRTSGSRRGLKVASAGVYLALAGVAVTI